MAKPYVIAGMDKYRPPETVIVGEKGPEIVFPVVPAAATGLAERARIVAALRARADAIDIRTDTARRYAAAMALHEAWRDIERGEL